MTVIIAPQAKRDLRNACEYLRKRSPRAAEQFLEDFTATVELLRSGLVEGRPAVLKSGMEVHSWSFAPYRIYYRRKMLGQLEIVRVYHQSRRPIERP